MFHNNVMVICWQLFFIGICSTHLLTVWIITLSKWRQWYGLFVYYFFLELQEFWVRWSGWGCSDLLKRHINLSFDWQVNTIWWLMFWYITVGNGRCGSCWHCLVITTKKYMLEPLQSIHVRHVTKTRGTCTPDESISRV